ncbi:MAG: OadG family protein [Tannerellaceae bacterium]|jgi:oxaloacetate decarboxylase gamma subunit|nr:OadG family protein [Tannerellaceae bacterium]
MEHLQTGFLLMAVGMTTVFLILLLVIQLGKGLAALVNRYAPEEGGGAKKQAPGSGQAAIPVPKEEESSNRATVVAILSAVGLATGGRGKVIKIEKQP